jgi:CelD/BcsL family acetyltransferase involved in cellulose biosynthesis
MLRLSTLSLDGQAIAMVWLFEDGGAFYLYNSGYDPAFAPLAAGLLSKALAIREACALGKRHFDFLRGEEDYKRRLGGADRELVTLALRSG